VRQVLRANPYEIVKAGSSGRDGRRLTVRDVLLGLQIAICAVLVTSSMVAVRGLVRSLHGNFGFELHNAMLVGTNLAMAGYSGDRVPAMQKRMIHAMEAIPGVERVGLVNNYPPLVYGAGSRVSVFKEETRDLRPANADPRIVLATMGGPPALEPAERDERDAETLVTAALNGTSLPHY